MPTWWGKSSSKEEKKKANKESLIDTFHRKFKTAFEENSNSRSRGSCRRRNDIVAERSHALPLPLPSAAPPITSPNGSNIRSSKRLVLDGGSEPPLLFPLPEPLGAASRVDNSGTEADLITASVSSGSLDGGNSDFLLSPLAPDYQNLNRTAITAPSSQKNSGELLKPATFNSQNLITPRIPKRRPLGSHVQNLQIPQRDVLCSAPDSLLSSPSRSPMRSFVPEDVSNHGLLVGKPYSDFGLLGSGKCSSPGSGHNSGNNSVGGEMSGQQFCPQSRFSPESSPVPSPRMRSPGPSSRIQSGAGTPLHPRSTTGSPTRQLDNSRQESHWLPHPKITNSSQLSPTYSAATSPSVPRSPARTETPVSPGSRWKKGRLLGRGSFGHVYLGFNSDSGEFCAMKEVTLSPDDPKSKESAQQLGQEISLLSRLQHPNIVHYYGSETVDDKLYIYLEYVSGGSIYKLLQEYGQFGENAIRNYTQQILSGLTYLHERNTVHRDIKGANILVHPGGRVKLADFGMAKHITTQSGPLSFKGSPYWMAPEVIKNSNGSNLACDIWSLGCTVLEMATTKPPWSQYGGVPAMFKIGNSKELPEIPDYLSDEGKDFVIQCLKRNPKHRPSAAELLDHPFIRNAVPFERPVLVAEPSDTTPAVVNSTITQVPGNARNVTFFESNDVTSYHSLGLKTNSGFSASHTPRNMSCPISPIGSPILHSGSRPWGRRSPSPISSPHAVSGSSTPLTHQMIQTPNNLHEGARIISGNPQSSRYTNNTSIYSAPNSSRAAQLFWDNGSDGGWMKDGGQLLLADHVSQQLLSEHFTSKHSFELKTASSTQSSNH